MVLVATNLKFIGRDAPTDHQQSPPIYLTTKALMPHPLFSPLSLVLYEYFARALARPHVVFYEVSEV